MSWQNRDDISSNQFTEVNVLVALAHISDELISAREIYGVQEGKMLQEIGIAEFGIAENYGSCLTRV